MGCTDDRAGTATSPNQKLPDHLGWTGSTGGQKKHLSSVIAKSAHVGSGLQHQAGAGPPHCRGSAMPWLACPCGGGGTQYKGLLSQQMVSRLPVGWESCLCGSHATTCTPRVARKTKQNKTASSVHCASSTFRQYTTQTGGGVWWWHSGVAGGAMEQAQTPCGPFFLRS